MTVRALVSKWSEIMLFDIAQRGDMRSDAILVAVEHGKGEDRNRGRTVRECTRALFRRDVAR